MPRLDSLDRTFADFLQSFGGPIRSVAFCCHSGCRPNTPTPPPPPPGIAAMTGSASTVLIAFNDLSLRRQESLQTVKGRSLEARLGRVFYIKIGLSATVDRDDMTALIKAEQTDAGHRQKAADPPPPPCSILSTSISTSPPPPSENCLSGELNCSSSWFPQRCKRATMDLYSSLLLAQGSGILA